MNKYKFTNKCESFVVSAKSLSDACEKVQIGCKDAITRTGWQLALWLNKEAEEKSRNLEFVTVGVRHNGNNSEVGLTLKEAGWLSVEQTKKYIRDLQSAISIAEEFTQQLRR